MQRLKQYILCLVVVVPPAPILVYILINLTPVKVVTKLIAGYPERLATHVAVKYLHTPPPHIFEVNDRKRQLVFVMGVSVAR